MRTCRVAVKAALALIVVLGIGMSAVAQPIPPHRIILVPDDYSTIQAAIDASEDGDTIRVRPGTYGRIQFYGKNVTVISMSCAGDTHIDGGGVGPVVQFNYGETRDAKLIGFTVKGGRYLGGDGGGISCYRSCPTIKDNIIVDNYAESGAGISCDEYSAALIEGNLIHHNFNATLDDPLYGGGICIRHSSTKIVNNQIYENRARYGGGIVVLEGSTGVIVDNQIYENHASYGGSIAVLEESWAELQGNQIQGHATVDGGGIYCKTAGDGLSPVKVVGGAIRECTAVDGGGIYAEDSYLEVIEDCRISDNVAGFTGGGIQFGGDVCGDRAPTIKVSDCVITNNQGGWGGGIYCSVECGGSVIANSFIDYNSASFGGGIYADTSEYSNEMGVIIEIEKNRIKGNTATCGGGLCYQNDNVMFPGPGYYVIRKNLFAENVATSAGGGVYDHTPRQYTVFQNNLIARNVVSEGTNVGGAGICLYSGGYLSIVNCTIVENVVQGQSGRGGGLYCDHGTLINNIFWGNGAPGGGAQIYYGTIVSVDYCNVEGGWPGGTNIDDDPQLTTIFYRPSAVAPRPPCVDGGRQLGAPATDFEDDDRPYPVLGRVDMGWDEVIY